MLALHPIWVALIKDESGIRQNDVSSRLNGLFMKTRCETRPQMGT